jgi:hypothetical protein
MRRFIPRGSAKPVKTENTLKTSKARADKIPQTIRQAFPRRIWEIATMSVSVLDWNRHPIR